MRGQPEAIKRLNTMIDCTTYVLAEMKRLRKQLKYDITLERA